MKTWKIVLAVMLIFGAGVVTGGMLVRTRVPARPPLSGPLMGGPAGLFGQGRQQFVQRLQRQLDLSREQKAEVDRILRDSHERMAKIWDPIAPAAREETRKVRQEIQAVLSPPQKAKFNEVFKPRRPRETEDRKDWRPRRDRTDLNDASPKERTDAQPVKTP